MAVLVQEMVPANSAGVVFTSDPLTGDPGRIVIEGAPGLGDALVFWQGESRRYVVARTRSKSSIVNSSGQPPEPRVATMNPPERGTPDSSGSPQPGSAGCRMNPTFQCERFMETEGAGGCVRGIRWRGPARVERLARQHLAELALQPSGCSVNLRTWNGRSRATARFLLQSRRSTRAPVWRAPTPHVGATPTCARISRTCSPPMGWSGLARKWSWAFFRLTCRGSASISTRGPGSVESPGRVYVNLTTTHQVFHGLQMFWRPGPE